MSNRQIALYSRVSSDRQSAGLESQQLALKRYCESHGISKFEMYADFNVSGVKASRPKLDQLMKDIRDDKISMLIVFSFSRFARSTRHLLGALEEFEHRNVKFVSISEKIDTGSPLGRAMFTIVAALAALERDTLISRVRCGLANAASKGRYPGRPKTRPSELIQTLAKQGHNYRKIARLTGVSPSTVSRELRSTRTCSKNIKNPITKQLTPL